MGEVSEIMTLRLNIIELECNYGKKVYAKHEEEKKILNIMLKCREMMKRMEKE